jgi:PhnB protein
MQVQPYLNFDGRTEEAIEFYRTALGAKVNMLMRYKDSPMANDPRMSAPGDKIMHANLTVGSTEILASDSKCGGKPSFQGISLSLTLTNAAEAEKYFTALAVGGQVQMPLAKTFFSPSFGMLADKFGISWMVYVKQAGA